MSLNARSGSIVNLSGGRFHFDFDTATDSAVRLIGGEFRVDGVPVAGLANVGDSVPLKVPNGTVISGTFAAENLQINFDDAELNIAGGSINDLSVGSFDDSTTEVNWSGGSIGDGYFAGFATLNLFGTGFLLNGAAVSGLMVDEPRLVTTRSGTISGMLADSTPFSFNLAHLSSNATLSIALVADRLFGDYNRDGHVDAADYTMWRNSVGDLLTPGHAADGNFNGIVDEADYLLWKLHFSSVAGGSGASSDAVPEPTSTCVLLTLAFVVTLLGRPIRKCRSIN